MSRIWVVDWSIVGWVVLYHCATLNRSTRKPRVANVPDESADVLVESHVVEHTHSALLALRNALRVLRPGGFLLFVLPNKCVSFDLMRVVTSWEHHLEEFNDDLVRGVAVWCSLASNTVVMRFSRSCF